MKNVQSFHVIRFKKKKLCVFYPTYGEKRPQGWGKMPPPPHHHQSKKQFALNFTAKSEYCCDQIWIVIKITINNYELQNYNSLFENKS